MLTIAGSGINLYSLKELADNVRFNEFDCIVADINFDNLYNKSIIPAGKEIVFLPFGEVKQYIKNKFFENKKILYVVTGSPMFFSATDVLLNFLRNEIPDFDSNMVDILPAESSKSYLLRKLKISENNVIALSMHGRSIINLDLTKFLAAKYTFLLCDDNSLYSIYQYTKYFQDDLVFYLGSKLGSEDEKIETVNLKDIVERISVEDVKNIYSPYVLLIERKYELSQSISGNEDFSTNAGMLTKTDKRAVTLQALELFSNLVMWDIGAGSGSVSIDAYKLFKIRTFLFEKNPIQCDFIKENLARHKVAAVELFEGNVVQHYHNVSKPDRIFIGGGGEEVLARIVELYNELNENGLIVANIVGLENLSTAIESVKNTELRYDIRSIDITNYKKISEKIKLSLAEPERTLYQFIMRK